MLLTGFHHSVSYLNNVRIQTRGIRYKLPTMSGPLVLVAEHGDEARRRAQQYSGFYQGRRGSMVLDVVTSRQRRYQNRVLPLVARWGS
jgi:hypothetical protein